MNEHEHSRELISRLLDEDTALTEAENRQLRAHLADCADCAALYAAFAAVSKAIGENLTEPPAQLREKVMGEVRREEIRRRNRKNRRWAGAAAAAAVLALIIGFAPRMTPKSDTAQGALYAAAVSEERAFFAAAEENAAVSADALLAFLGGVAPESVPGEDAEPAFSVETEAGTVVIYRAEGRMWYADPVSGALRETARTEAEIREFLQNGA